MLVLTLIITVSRYSMIFFFPIMIHFVLNLRPTLVQRSQLWGFFMIPHLPKWKKLLGSLYLLLARSEKPHRIYMDVIQIIFYHLTLQLCTSRLFEVLKNILRLLAIPVFYITCFFTSVLPLGD